jgi:hypothetical protein
MNDVIDIIRVYSALVTTQYKDYIDYIPKVFNDPKS